MPSSGSGKAAGVPVDAPRPAGPVARPVHELQRGREGGVADAGPTGGPHQGAGGLAQDVLAVQRAAQLAEQADDAQQGEREEEDR
jgi:hypothetical protein